MQTRRKDIEAETLRAFESVAAALGLAIDGRGYGAANRFDPDFGLTGQKRFQFGDLRIALPDRIVIVEVESGGGLTNLVKYWPLAESDTPPVLLLHAFGQNSVNDYLSHLRLWDFTWGKMRERLWAANDPKLFAQRYTFTHGVPAGLSAAAEAFRRCLTEALPIVLREIFGYNTTNNRLSTHLMEEGNRALQF